MIIAEMLKKGKSLILNKENWNQDGAYVADMPLTYAHMLSDKSNLCMCGVGAVVVAVDTQNFYLNDLLSIGDWMSSKVRKITKGKFISFFEFNDSDKTTHQDVLDMFDRLIAIAEVEKATLQLNKKA